jgi:acyl-CoA synthetase (AMP-forming)/AMP-acid ligase II
VWLRGPNVTPGYFNRPAETAAALTPDGWLRTGDGGYVDEEGFLFLTDRIKDMIVSGGENVYPVEVEEALAQHPDVADVAVIGVPHPVWGEAVKALVVPRPGARTTGEELIASEAGLSSDVLVLQAGADRLDDAHGRQCDRTRRASELLEPGIDADCDGFRLPRRRRRVHQPPDRP